ncbi:hypothetical protein OROGR_017803 [Orobanche gracilis]
MLTNGFEPSARQLADEIVVAEQYIGDALAFCSRKPGCNKGIDLLQVKAETLVLQGDPKDKICEAAEDLHVDLVVVGSRGFGMVKRALLESVSNYCAHHAYCPVLVVKPPAKLPHD